MSTLNPSDLEEDAQQGASGEIFGDNHGFFGLTDPLDALGSESVSMASQDAFENNRLVGRSVTDKPEQNIIMAIDNDANDTSAFNSQVNSPRETVSPTASSPFSAMESDGEGVETGQDDGDTNLSCAGEPGDQSFNRTNGYFGSSTPLYTTTPCASSSCCENNDEEYESTGSRKKRRKTRRDMHHNHGPAFTMPVAQLSKQPSSELQPDPETSPFSPPVCPKGMSFAFGNNGGRRTSGGTNITNVDDEYSHENAKRTRKNTDRDEEMSISNVKIEIANNMDTAAALTQSIPPMTDAAIQFSKTTVTTEEEQMLHKQYPKKSGPYELHIVVQPEPQHRARYLTEGSRGPVKDAAQTGFPRVQLLGYNKPATLQVFVATDSGKIKPHGFYQACKVTGRNTSSCEETEIEGTKVIEIPFKQEEGSMVLNVDCVGILKLRNTDVEVRTGVRNQKRNQSVRLVFRVVLSVPAVNKKIVATSGGVVVLQAASTRISCTQPLGQPEITKKSVDRCSVEGGIEMFIIGKNFHRGTKVIYQDPEEPDGKQWSAEGEIEKDTFHQYHMVVRVPPYHDQNIVKPVNVQLIVEFQDKKCEPHSFTYTPRPKDLVPPKEEVKPRTATSDPSIESAMRLFERFDKKLLAALLTNLCTGIQNSSLSGCNTPEGAKEISTPASIIPNTIQSNQSLLGSMLLQGQANQPLPQVVNNAVQTIKTNPMSPPSTLMAGISVQPVPPAFAQPAMGDQGQPQPIHAYTGTPPVLGGNSFAGTNDMKLIKTEAGGIEPSTFCTAVTVPSVSPLISSMSQPNSLPVGNTSMPIVMTQNITSPTMVVSPVSGQTLPPNQKALCFNSFATSNTITGSEMAGVALETQHSIISQSSKAHIGSAVCAQVREPSTVGGTVQQPMAAAAIPFSGSSTTLHNFSLSSFPSASVQLNPQNLSNVTSLAGSTSGMMVEQPAPVVVEGSQFSQILASPAVPSFTLQNSQNVVQSNVLQQPTFNFQNSFANAVTTTATQNPHIMTKAIPTSQVMSTGQMPLGQVQLLMSVGDASPVQQSMVADQPSATAKPHQPYAAIAKSMSENSDPQVTFTIASKDTVNLPTQPFVTVSIPSSPAHAVNPNFIVTVPGHVIQQSFNTQTHHAVLAAVNQGTTGTVFQGQFNQIQTCKDSSSHAAFGQTPLNIVESGQTQIHAESHSAPQNLIQVHRAMVPQDSNPLSMSNISALTNAEPMDGVTSSNMSNNQSNETMLPDHQMAEVMQAATQPQARLGTILIQHQLPMVTESSPPSGTNLSSPPTENMTQITPGFAISQNFPVTQSTNTAMLVGSTSIHSMELEQPQTATYQQQQPSQNSSPALQQDVSAGDQDIQMKNVGNIHNTSNFHSPAFITIPNSGGGNNPNTVEVRAFTGLQRQIQENNNATNFHGGSVLNDVTGGNFNQQGIQGNVCRPNELEGMQQNVQRHSSTSQTFPSNATSNNANSIGTGQTIQGLQQSQNLPANQNFQASPMNFNAGSFVQLEAQVDTGNAPANVLGIDNFKSHTAVNIIQQTQAGIVASKVSPQIFQNSQNDSVSLPDQQYQTGNQATHSPPQGITAHNTQNHQFMDSSNSKDLSVDAHSQIGATYSFDGNHGVVSPQNNTNNIETTALRHQGQHLLDPCTNSTVNPSLEPRSPDIYGMTQLLQSIDASEHLATISGEDVQRHFQ